MDFLNLIIIVFGGILLFGILILLFRGSKKLTESDFKKFAKKIEKTGSLDPAHAIMESHKIFVAAISVLYPDKNRTSVQKISKVVKQFPNERQIWKFHRMRNRIAHETDTKVLRTEAELARKEFIRALKSISKV